MRSNGILTMGTAFPRVPPRNDHCYITQKLNSNLNCKLAVTSCWNVCWLACAVDCFCELVVFCRIVSATAYHNVQSNSSAVSARNAIITLLTLLQITTVSPTSNKGAVVLWGPVPRVCVIVLCLMPSIRTRSHMTVLININTQHSASAADSNSNSNVLKQQRAESH